MAYPNPTTGVGVAAKIVVAGNVNPTNTKPGYNNVVLSLSGANGPTSFQLNPILEDAAGNTITPGTAFTLSAVAASTPGVLTLSAAANASGGSTVYTGTITGGGSNAFAGQTFTVAGFTTAANNGTFICTASSTTTLTLSNESGASETHAGTATDITSGTAVYTGTITGGGTNAFAGYTFVVAGFSTAANNGTFIATASSSTTLTLANASAAAETHAATATSEEIIAGNVLTYFADGAASLTGGTSPISGSTAKVVSVSSTGNLTTNGVEGGSVVEVSYPTFNNSSGTTGAQSGNPMQNLPLNKIYAEVNVTVVK